MDSFMLQQLQMMMTGGRMPTTVSQKNYYDKEFLLNEHEKCLAEHDARVGNTVGNYQIRTTATATLHSSVPVELVPANQVTIRKLIKAIDQVLHGKFFLCRVIAPAVKFSALAMIVEDPPGILAIRLSLYNYVQEVDHLPLAQSVRVLPVGTILAIKNPWFKQTVDGGLALRCDNPADVVVMNEAQLKKLNPSLEWKGNIPGRFIKYMSTKPGEKDDDWKRVGNEHFVAKRYGDAAEAYTNGLKSDENNIDLLANRAAAYLNLERFQLAMIDADRALKLNPSHLKAIYRKTKALWGLKKYDEARDFLETGVCRPASQDKEVKTLLSKSKLMISQLKYGQYPIDEIAQNKTEQQHGMINKLQNLDWAEYRGPIEVKKTGDDRGRGLFAKSKFKAGDLIMASKAFGLVAIEKDEKNFFMSVNVGTKSVKHASQAQLVTQVANRLRHNPDNGKHVYNLYAGSELGILDPDEDDCSIVDMKRIDSICSYNAFGMVSGFDGPSGLWILPSFINHSCIDCNCHWTIYGDFMFVRCFKDIEAGEEILISYINPVESYEKRMEVFESFKFECKCSLCEYDKQEPNLKSVTKEIEDLLNEIPTDEFGTPDLLRAACSSFAMPTLLLRLERLILLRPKYNVRVAPLLQAVAGYYFYMEDLKTSVHYLETSFYILENTPMRTEVLYVTTNLVRALLGLGQEKKARRWYKTMKEMAIRCWGTTTILEQVAPMLCMEMKHFGLE